MSLTKKLSKGAAVLFAGYSISYLISFVRNIVVARLIGPADFGIAATFIMTINLLDMVSNVNIDKLIVQSDQGDERFFQNTAHSIQVLRNLVTSVIIFFLAAPIARFFGVPEAIWAYRFLALVPLLRGFSHFDVKRFHRKMIYGPDCKVEIMFQLTAFIVAISLAVSYRNYSAMIWALVAQSIVWVICTHILAKRNYKLSWDKNSVKLFFNFGWPLLINGLLMFGIFQGDRAIIARFMGMIPLGIYAAAAGLTMMPQMFISRIATSLLLPPFSRSKDSTGIFLSQYQMSTQALAIVAMMISVITLIAGNGLIICFYGIEYQDATKIIGLLGIAQTIAVLRITPTLAALAKGDSISPMLASFFRVSVLVGLLIFALSGAELVWIAACAIMGELLALIALVIKVNHKHKIPLVSCFYPLTVVLIGVSITAVFSMAGFSSEDLLSSLAMAVIFSLLLSTLMLIPFSELRKVLFVKFFRFVM